MPEQDKRPVAIEVARTSEGVTYRESHLRPVGAGILLCGLGAPTRDTDWIPVADDEADRFNGCPGCERRAASYRVASRPPKSLRGWSADVLQGTIAGLEDVPPGFLSLAARISQAALDDLTGSAIVPLFILRDLMAISWRIAEEATGDGSSPDAISGQTAGKRLPILRDLAMQIRYDLASYVKDTEAVDPDRTAADAQRAEILGKVNRIHEECHVFDPDGRSECVGHIHKEAVDLLGMLDPAGLYAIPPDNEKQPENVEACD